MRLDTGKPSGRNRIGGPIYPSYNGPRMATEAQYLMARYVFEEMEGTAAMNGNVMRAQ